MSNQKINENTNLLELSNSENKEIKFYHRQLKTGSPGSRVKVTNYTINDLWNYFVLSTRGAAQTENLNTFLDREERKQFALQIINSSRSYDKDEFDVMVYLVLKYGIEITLYNIDSFADSNWQENSKVIEGVPYFKDTYEFINETYLDYNRLVIEKNRDF
jgi:hypothetical protein